MGLHHSTGRGSHPSQQTHTAKQALLMICDGDENQVYLSSDDSVENKGKGSDDEEIADDVCRLLGQTAPAHRESDDSDGSVEQANADLEHSERL